MSGWEWYQEKRVKKKMTKKLKSIFWQTSLDVRILFKLLASLTASAPLLGLEFLETYGEPPGSHDFPSHPFRLWNPMSMRWSLDKRDVNQPENTKTEQRL